MQMWDVSPSASATPQKEKKWQTSVVNGKNEMKQFSARPIALRRKEKSSASDWPSSLAGSWPGSG